MKLLLLQVTLLAAVISPAIGADLTIQRLSLHHGEDGPVIAPGYEYLPGQEVWLTCRIFGYEAEPIEVEGEVDVTHMRVSWEIGAVDPVGVPLEPGKSGDVDEQLSREDEGWVAKVVVMFKVPSFAPEGTYRLPVTVTDQLDGEQITGELTFRVRGEELPAAESLDMRNFGYLAHQEDRFPMQPAIYHPGDTLFSSFQIIGYQIEQGNRFAVSYGLTAYGPDGEPMFTQPVAAEESGQDFYPKRWVPAGFSLNLDDDIKPGDYAIGITVRDTLRGTEREFKQPFRIQ